MSCKNDIRTWIFMFAWSTFKFITQQLSYHVVDSLLMFMVMNHEVNYRTMSKNVVEGGRKNERLVDVTFLRKFHKSRSQTRFSSVTNKEEDGRLNNGQTWLVKLSPTSLQFQISLRFATRKVMQTSFLHECNSICVQSEMETTEEKTFYEVISIWEKRNTSFIPILMGNGKKGSKKKPERKIHILCKTIKSIDIILLQDGIIVSCWCCFSFCFVIEWNILLLFRLV